LFAPVAQQVSDIVNKPGQIIQDIPGQVVEAIGQADLDPKKVRQVQQSIIDFTGGAVKFKGALPRVGALAAVGAVLDVGGVQAAVQEPMGTRESLATALEGVSSAAGLASLTPAAPIAGPVSMATGAAAMAVRGKAEQKLPQALEKVQEVQQQVFPLQGMLNQLVPKFINGAMRLAMP
jgi:hypothetical protein